MVAEATRLAVRVTPDAPRNHIVGKAQGVWRVKVAAPPVDGRANEELVSFMAGLLGVPRRQISLLLGHRSRSKVLAIAGLSPEEVATRLERATLP